MGSPSLFADGNEAEADVLGMVFNVAAVISEIHSNGIDYPPGGGLLGTRLTASH